MNDEIRILMLEDVPTDAQLIQYELTRSKIAFQARVVDTEEDFRRTLGSFHPDLILSDYSLPMFDGISAYLIARKLVPDTPFIFVSGEIGEDLAIEAMRLGVTDYVFKDRLKRLAPAIKRALAEVDEKIKRKKAENELLLMASIVESSDDAIMSISLEGVIMSCNNGTLSMLGYSREELLKKPLSMILSAGEDEAVRLMIEKIRSGEKVSHYESRNLRKDGRALDVSMTLSPIRDTENKLIGISTISRDISERKENERKISEMNRTLEERVVEEVAKNREKDALLIKQSRLVAMGELIRNIAHYWRQPLNAMGLIIQNIQYAYKNGKLTEEYIDDVISRSMDTLQSLSESIDSFRIFSRSETEKTCFNVKEVLEKTISFVAPGFKNDLVEIESELEDGIEVLNYSTDLNNTLIQLLNNAREAMLERQVAAPFISVRLKKEKDHAVIIITDKGGGVKPEAADHIFEPYFSTRETSTGLGLYMSKIMVEQNMGGGLSFRNVAEGAEFTIIIPASS